MKSTKPALLTLLVSSSICFGSAVARADEEIPSPQACVPNASASGAPAAVLPAAKAPPPSEWYGWQVLVADASSLSLGIVGGLGGRSLPAAGLGAVTYVGVSPIIHGVHGNAGAALGSLGLRVAMPTGGLFLGAAIGNGSSRSDQLGGVIVGAFTGAAAGMVLATVIDTTLLARADKAPEPVPAGKVVWRPNLGVSQRGAEVGVSGAF